MNEEERANVIEVLLESLVFKRMDSRLLNIRAAQRRTCEWLFEQPQYKDWRNRNNVTEHHGFLWIKGKPGCGKSTIMKTALAQLKQERPHDITLSYFFNARAPDPLEKSSLGMYRSLVHQLLTVIPEFQEDFGKQFLRKVSGEEVDEWTIIELQNFISSVLDGLQGRSLNFFIDALDEGEDDDVRNMIAFLEELGDSSLSNTASVNICLSSRHYPHINIRNGISLNVEDQQGHEQDVNKYVRNKLSGDNGPQHETLMADVCQKASGVFLWVVLVVPMLNALYDQGNEPAMKKRLQEIPAELDGLFSEILGRNPDTTDKSVLLLQWVLFSSRPLSPSELYLCLIAETGTLFPDGIASELPHQARVARYILNCSKGLTEISKSEPPTVLFIHETIRGFLLQSNGLSILKPEIGANLIGRSHDQLKKCCMDIFEVGSRGFNEKEWIENMHSEFPAGIAMLEYATSHVFEHANIAEDHGVSQFSFLRSFQVSSVEMKRWIRFKNFFERYKSCYYSADVTLLYIFSESNLLGLVKLLLKEPIDWNGTGTRYGSPLQAACANGHEETVRSLVNAGADINRKGGEHCHALIAAADKEHHVIVRLLHKRGAKVSHEYLGLLDQRLFTAIEDERTERLTLMLDIGANVNTENEQTHKPLSMAALKGNKSMANIMLERGARVEAQDGAALRAAVAGGAEDIVRLLLDEGADVNAHHEIDGDALTEAMWKGNIEISQLLLDKGANVNAQGGRNGNALQVASEQGHFDAVQLLLTRNADVNAKGGNFGHVLQAASYHGHLKIVRLLLDHGAFVNARGGFYETALQAASRWGHVAVVRLLLDNDADANIRGGKYGSAIQAARANTENSKRDISKIVALLQKRDAGT